MGVDGIHIFKVTLKSMANVDIPGVEAPVKVTKSSPECENANILGTWSSYTAEVKRVTAADSLVEFNAKASFSDDYCWI